MRSELPGAGNSVFENWVYFAPAWLHAAIVPFAARPAFDYCQGTESCFIAVCLIPLVLSWGVGLMPVWKRRVPAETAMACILLPQAPYVIHEIFTAM